MKITKDSSLKVMGVGKVGLSIIQALAQSGFAPVGLDISEDQINKGLKELDNNLTIRVNKGKLDANQKRKIISRVKMSSNFDSLRDTDVVIEAVFENMQVKKDLFKMLAKNVRPEALILTNTSSLSVSEMASVVQNPHRFAGMHFFYPVPAMNLVEVVKGVETSQETIDTVKDFAKAMGKTPIVCKDSAAFVVNRMLNALVIEACRIVEEGIASIEDVDIAARLGLRHPMGPFELIDFINGVSLLTHVTEYMEKELGERFRLPVWVKNLSRAGWTGKDSGKGFYIYSQEKKE